MKFNLEFSLKENHLPLDHVRCFVSFLKKSLQSADAGLYQELYETNTPKMKPYTFSLYLPNRKVEGEQLVLSGNKIRLTFSCSDLELAIAFLNGFTEQKGEIFSLPDRNEMVLTRFTTEMHPAITEDHLVIRFLSPLLVLQRESELRKNHYLTWKDENFAQQLKENLMTQLNEFSINTNYLNSFELVPLKPKQLGQRVFGQLVLGNGGIYQLKGHPELLQFLLEAGIGSRRSAGFGLFEIIS